MCTDVVPQIANHASISAPRAPQIVEVEMPFDKQKNQRKAFCFITFDSEQVVNELLKTPKQTISGKEVDVKKATPKPDNVPGTYRVLAQTRVPPSRNWLINSCSMFGWCRQVLEDVEIRAAVAHPVAASRKAAGTTRATAATARAAATMAVAATTAMPAMMATTVATDTAATTTLDTATAEITVNTLSTSGSRWLRAVTYDGAFGILSASIMGLSWLWPLWL